MPTIINISTYKFADLTELKSLRDRLIERCKAWNLKGTILLSTEGINLFVAGGRAEIDLLMAELRTVAGLEGLEPKISVSREQPFHRMLVKIKREIIAFGVEGIDPARQTAPKIAPLELKRWLDEGRPVTLLDTRNDYEFQLGTFQQALCLDIDHFREFPEAVRKLPETLKKQPIVMFCTGGIRCEKAGPFMQREGFEQIFQLDGGILKYFEECGAAHYDGECFVFDQRVGVDPSLHESEMAQCFVCQTPLTIADQEDERFSEGLSCPYCFLTTEEQRAQTLEQRHATLQRVTTPLPGSHPYENLRPLNVPLEYDGQSVLDFLCGILGHVSREEWRLTCEEARIRKRSAKSGRKTGLESTLPVAAEDLVRGGERYLHVQRFTREPDVNPNVRIVYEDEAILVVNKPAPLPMHPCGRFNRNTLQHFLSEAYYPQSPRPAHRLDANTTGLVLFARTKHFAKLLQRQFDVNSDSAGVKKRYLARVHGHPAKDCFTCDLPISDEAGPYGSREVDLERGLPAHTDFRVLTRFEDGTSLLEVEPRTGRTNQIRVHLWSLNHAICNDPTYLPERKLGESQTSNVAAASLCLLAQRIDFIHPLTKAAMSFEAVPLDWCQH